MLVRTIVELAVTIKLHCVAEGIEDKETADDLIALGCEFGQGYHFGRPADGATVTAVLESQRALAV